VEVERLVVVPLAKVLERDNYQPRAVNWEGVAMRQVALTHGQDVIWGATARMLMNLLDALGDSAKALAALAGNGAQKAVDSRRGVV